MSESSPNLPEAAKKPTPPKLKKPLPKIEPLVMTLERAACFFDPPPSRYFFWRLEKRGKLKPIRLSNHPKAPKYYRIADLRALLECAEVDESK